MPQRRPPRPFAFLIRCEQVTGEDRQIAPPISLVGECVVLGRGLEPPAEKLSALLGADVRQQRLQWLSVDDDRVSRVHCSITAHFATGRFPPLVSIEDHARNGTFLNGIPLEQGQPTILSDGDRISLVLSVSPLSELSYKYEEASLPWQYGSAAASAASSSWGLGSGPSDTSSPAHPIPAPPAALSALRAAAVAAAAAADAAPYSDSGAARDAGGGWLLARVPGISSGDTTGANSCSWGSASQCAQPARPLASDTASMDRTAGPQRSPAAAVAARRAPHHLQLDLGAGPGPWGAPALPFPSPAAVMAAADGAESDGGPSGARGHPADGCTASAARELPASGSAFASTSAAAAAAAAVAAAAAAAAGAAAEASDGSAAAASLPGPALQPCGGVAGAGAGPGGAAPTRSARTVSVSLPRPEAPHSTTAAPPSAPAPLSPPVSSASAAAAAPGPVPSLGSHASGSGSTRGSLPRAPSPPSGAAVRVVRRAELLHGAAALSVDSSANSFSSSISFSGHILPMTTAASAASAPGAGVGAAGGGQAHTPDGSTGSSGSVHYPGGGGALSASSSAHEYRQQQQWAVSPRRGGAGRARRLSRLQQMSPPGAGGVAPQAKGAGAREHDTRSAGGAQRSPGSTGGSDARGGSNSVARKHRLCNRSSYNGAAEASMLANVHTGHAAALPGGTAGTAAAAAGAAGVYYPATTGGGGPLHRAMLDGGAVCGAAASPRAARPNSAGHGRSSPTRHQLLPMQHVQSMQPACVPRMSFGPVGGPESPTRSVASSCGSWAGEAARSDGSWADPSQQQRARNPYRRHTRCGETMDTPSPGSIGSPVALRGAAPPPRLRAVSPAPPPHARKDAPDSPRQGHTHPALDAQPVPDRAAPHTPVRPVPLQRSPTTSQHPAAAAQPYVPPLRPQQQHDTAASSLYHVHSLGAWALRPDPTSLLPSSSAWSSDGTPTHRRQGRGRSRRASRSECQQVQRGGSRARGGSGAGLEPRGCMGVVEEGQEAWVAPISTPLTPDRLSLPSTELEPPPSDFWGGGETDSAEAEGQNLGHGGGGGYGMDTPRTFAQRLEERLRPLARAAAWVEANAGAADAPGTGGACEGSSARSVCYGSPRAGAAQLLSPARSEGSSPACMAWRGPAQRAVRSTHTWSNPLALSLPPDGRDWRGSDRGSCFNGGSPRAAAAAAAAAAGALHHSAAAALMHASGSASATRARSSSCQGLVPAPAPPPHAGAPAAHALRRRSTSTSGLAAAILGPAPAPALTAGALSSFGHPPPAAAAATAAGDRTPPRRRQPASRSGATSRCSSVARKSAYDSKGRRRGSGEQLSPTHSARTRSTARTHAAGGRGGGARTVGAARDPSAACRRSVVSAEAEESDGWEVFGADAWSEASGHDGEAEVVLLPGGKLPAHGSLATAHGPAHRQHRSPQSTPRLRASDPGVGASRALAAPGAHGARGGAGTAHGSFNPATFHRMVADWLGHTSSSGAGSGASGGPASRVSYSGFSDAGMDLLSDIAEGVCSVAAAAGGGGTGARLPPLPPPPPAPPAAAGGRRGLRGSADGARCSGAAPEARPAVAPAPAPLLQPPSPRAAAAAAATRFGAASGYDNDSDSLADSLEWPSACEQPGQAAAHRWSHTGVYGTGGFTPAAAAPPMSPRPLPRTRATSVSADGRAWQGAAAVQPPAGASTSAVTGYGYGAHAYAPAGGAAAAAAAGARGCAPLQHPRVQLPSVCESEPASSARTTAAGDALLANRYDARRATPATLLCRLCMGPLRSAVALQPCGHSFCAPCLSRHLAAVMVAGGRLQCPERCADAHFELVAINRPARHLEQLTSGPRAGDRSTGHSPRASAAGSADVELDPVQQQQRQRQQREAEQQQAHARGLLRRVSSQSGVPHVTADPAATPSRLTGCGEDAGPPGSPFRSAAFDAAATPARGRRSPSAPAAAAARYPAGGAVRRLEEGQEGGAAGAAAGAGAEEQRSEEMAGLCPLTDDMLPLSVLHLQLAQADELLARLQCLLDAVLGPAPAAARPHEPPRLSPELLSAARERCVTLLGAVADLAEAHPEVRELLRRQGAVQALVRAMQGPWPAPQQQQQDDAAPRADNDPSTLQRPTPGGPAAALRRGAPADRSGRQRAGTPGRSSTCASAGHACVGQQGSSTAQGDPHEEPPAPLLVLHAACRAAAALLPPADEATASTQWALAKAGAVEVLLAALGRVAVKGTEHAAGPPAQPGAGAGSSSSSGGEGAGERGSEQLVALALLRVLRLLASGSIMTQAHVACEGLTAVLHAMRSLPHHSGLQAEALQLLAECARGSDAAHLAIRQQLLEGGVLGCAAASVRSHAGPADALLPAWSALLGVLLSPEMPPSLHRLAARELRRHRVRELLHDCISEVQEAHALDPPTHGSPYHAMLLQQQQQQYASGGGHAGSPELGLARAAAAHVEGVLWGRVGGQRVGTQAGQDPAGDEFSGVSAATGGTRNGDGVWARGERWVQGAWLRVPWGLLAAVGATGFTVGVGVGGALSAAFFMG